ncbi:hypothetical protein [Flavobacterium aquiphilum]|uniref:hypothetical protein n=1 Tax=Flavobacterium aquiphilum TaxID=3003261 RepID=UPI0024815B68|nr:hypothetical protein [Flavobacterium aquiphilum]
MKNRLTITKPTIMTQKSFNEWLDKISKTEKPSDEILAYYFGILETTNGYETYLVGSKEFHEDDEDWACNTDFVPADKYLKLGQAETDWKQILDQVKNHIENYTQTENFKNSFLRKAKAIATGFDSGDLHIIR